MHNVLDLILLTYEKLIEPVLLKFNVIEIVTQLVVLINDEIIMLFPDFIFTNNMVNATLTAIKFLALIAMLVFIRGGIPRYRYDFLTKIG